MKYTGLNLPAHCTMIEEHELHEIHGGGSILSFIQYLLSGFTINFGWGADNDSYDTSVSTSRPGWKHHQHQRRHQPFGRLRRLGCQLQPGQLLWRPAPSVQLIFPGRCAVSAAAFLFGLCIDFPAQNKYTL